MEYIFLGGTCGKNMWRETLMPLLEARGIDRWHIVDPVVEHWTKEVQQAEDKLKEDPTTLLVFVLATTDPSLSEQKFTSAYSLYEAIESLYEAQERTIVFFDTLGLDKRTAKGLMKIQEDIRKKHPHAVLVSSYPELVDRIVEKWTV